MALEQKAQCLLGESGLGREARLEAILKNCGPGFGSMVEHLPSAHRVLGSTPMAPSHTSTHRHTRVLASVDPSVVSGADPENL